MILPEEVGYLEAEGMEKTYNFRQEELAKNVDINTSKKVCYLIFVCIRSWECRTPTISFFRSLISISKTLALTLLIIPVTEGSWKFERIRTYSEIMSKRTIFTFQKPIDWR
jgi:hypothetical protein